VEPVLHVRDALEPRARRPADEAVDLVALVEEELGEVAAVLSGHAGDQARFFRLISSSPTPGPRFPAQPFAKIHRATAAARSTRYQPKSPRPRFSSQPIIHLTEIQAASAATANPTSGETTP
jgi:hypothetical protein